MFLAPNPNAPDINTALQGLRAQVGVRGKPGGVLGPRGTPGPTGPIANKPGLPTAPPSGPIAMPEVLTYNKPDMPQPFDALKDDVQAMQIGGPDELTAMSTSGAPAGVVGRGGAAQQVGDGRFGGNPPPEVLARRAAAGVQGAQLPPPSGDKLGISYPTFGADPRMAQLGQRRAQLAQRMRSRLGGVMGAGLGGTAVGPSSLLPPVSPMGGGGGGFSRNPAEY